MRTLSFGPVVPSAPVSANRGMFLGEIFSQNDTRVRHLTPVKASSVFEAISGSSLPPEEKVKLLTLIHNDEIERQGAEMEAKIRVLEAEKETEAAKKEAEAAKKVAAVAETKYSEALLKFTNVLFFKQRNKLHPRGMEEATEEKVRMVEEPMNAANRSELWMKALSLPQNADLLHGMRQHVCLPEESLQDGHHVRQAIANQVAWIYDKLSEQADHELASDEYVLIDEELLGADNAAMIGCIARYMHVPYEIVKRGDRELPRNVG